jgi:hypothetical protein
MITNILKRVLWVMMLLMIVVISVKVANGLLSDNLISYYAFENNLNDSKGTNHMINFATTNITGILYSGRNYSVTTDFSQLVSSTMYSGVNINFSISGWFRPVAISQATEATIISNQGSGTTGLALQRKASGANTEYICVFGNGSNWVSSDPFFLTADMWNHIVIIKDGNRFLIYANGTLLSNATGQNLANFTSTKNLTIGRYPDIATRNWFGDIDELGFWNRSLTSFEVSLLYNAGASLLYPFNDTPPSILPSYTIRNVQTPPDINSSLIGTVLIESLATNTTSNITGLVTEDTHMTLWLNVTTTLNNGCVIFNQKECQWMV